ncbi:MAG TPA: hypothetical protein V6D08_21485, partial [Candidatus Obscuribacterales bacterium]
RMHGPNYQERVLDGALMFTSAAQLLATLKPECVAIDDLESLIALATARNQCEFEHGFLPQQPKPEKVRQWLDKAKEIIGRIAGPSELDAWIERCRFPQLDSSGDRG